MAEILANGYLRDSFTLICFFETVKSLVIRSKGWVDTVISVLNIPSLSHSFRDFCSTSHQYGNISFHYHIYSNNYFVYAKLLQEL